MEGTQDILHAIVTLTHASLVGDAVPWTAFISWRAVARGLVFLRAAELNDGAASNVWEFSSSISRLRTDFCCPLALAMFNAASVSIVVQTDAKFDLIQIELFKVCHRLRNIPVVRILIDRLHAPASASSYRQQGEQGRR